MAHCQTLTKIMDATSNDELWQEWLRSMIQDFGFDRLLYVSTRFATGSALGNAGDQLILTNYCEDYLREFVDTELYQHGPMLKWALNNTGACSWSAIAEFVSKQEITPQMQDVLNLNKRYGVTAGYTISFQPINERSRSAISAAMNQNKSQSEADAIWMKHTRSLTLPHNTISGKQFKISPRYWLSRPKRLKNICVWHGIHWVLKQRRRPFYDWRYKTKFLSFPPNVVAVGKLFLTFLNLRKALPLVMFGE